MKHIVLAALAALAVTACSSGGSGMGPSGPALPPPDMDGDMDGDIAAPDTSPCGATQMGYLVGQQVGEVDLDSLSGHIRLIYPDTAVTEDYSPARLNLDLTESGVILRPWCG